MFCESVTAVVESVELEQVAVAELHALADHVAEGRDPGDDGGLRAVLEGFLAVMHHGSVVVGNVQGAGSAVVVFVEVMLLSCEMNVNMS